MLTLEAYTPRGGLTTSLRRRGTRFISSSAGLGKVTPRGCVQLHSLSSLLPQHWKGSGYINSLLWVLQVRRLFSRIKPDIVDAHYVTVKSYLGTLSGFRPLVLTAWGSDILIVLKESLCLRILVRYALKRAEMVKCNN